MAFLTVVTRCYKRPELLYNNIKSLKSQTDRDYEQVFIVDTVGHGLAAADRALGKYKDINIGKFVMVLDDDDMILVPNFIERLKQVDSNHSPSVIIWRGKFSHTLKQLPIVDENWGKQVFRGWIGSFNYAITNELYKKHINVCKSGNTGDFDLIEAVLSESPKTIWLKEVMVITQQKGEGS